MSAAQPFLAARDVLWQCRTDYERAYAEFRKRELARTEPFERAPLEFWEQDFVEETAIREGDIPR